MTAPATTSTSARLSRTSGPPGSTRPQASTATGPGGTFAMAKRPLSLVNVRSAAGEKPSKYTTPSVRSSQVTTAFDTPKTSQSCTAPDTMPVLPSRAVPASVASESRSSAVTSQAQPAVELLT